MIDTPEFQRLRRIRQLSTADKLFLSALHTRFSHSIGTYYVMKQIINHFKDKLIDMNMKISEDERDLALAAALLHDIGHGPYSHTFEDVIPDSNNKEHESWTAEIITSEKTEINSVLKEIFYDKFPEKVANLINNSFNMNESLNGFSNIDLSTIISSLVSSQLDADRMDYLLRDAFHTGVTYGDFDISRLISSLGISIDEFKDDKYFVCVLEKYKSTIEEYLLSRYQMHKEIYYHEFKVEMEEILKKIFQRVYYLFREKKIKNQELPQFFIDSFAGNKVKIEDYLELDDISILSLIKKWKKNEDKILSTLCYSFLNRKKFKRVNILNNSPNVIKEFKEKFLNILNQNDYKTEDLEKEYFWISKSIKEKKMYNEEEEIIWVLRNDGQIKNFIEVSDLIKNNKVSYCDKDNNNAEENDKDKEKIAKRIFFVNLEMLAHLIDNKNAIDEIERLIEMYNIRNHIEIEKKYNVKNEKIFDQVLNEIKNWDQEKYNITKSSNIKQTDHYYDTPDNKLSKSEITIRIRYKNNNKILTIKTPTEESNDRFEYEKKVGNKQLEYYADFILRYIPDLTLADIKRLEPKIKITNNRQVKIIKKNKVKFEMVFDDVNYYNNDNNNKYHEYQIEIELKSDYPHRVNLNLLGNYLEEKIDELKPIYDSKFIRALNFTENL